MLKPSMRQRPLASFVLDISLRHHDLLLHKRCFAHVLVQIVKSNNKIFCESVSGSRLLENPELPLENPCDIRLNTDPEPARKTLVGWNPTQGKRQQQPRHRVFRRSCIVLAPNCGAFRHDFVCLLRKRLARFMNDTLMLSLTMKTASDGSALAFAPGGRWSEQWASVVTVAPHEKKRVYGLRRVRKSTKHGRHVMASLILICGA